MVNSPDNFADYFGNPVNLTLLRHEVNLVVQGLSDLEDRVDQEPIVKFLLLLAEEGYHFLTQLLLHRLREVVQKTQQIFKTDQLAKIIASHHDLNKQKL